MPSALPQVMAGTRIAVAIAVGTMIVANMVGSSAGLGYFVISAQQSFDVMETWAGMVMIGLVGSERVMLGSDYPYDMAMMDCVSHVRSLKISDADKDAILNGNAEKMLSGK